MWLVFFASVLVSLDALFIGVSFGSQKKCKYLHIIIINTALFLLCMLGYLAGILIHGLDLEFDLVIGILFMLLGLWTIASYFIFRSDKINIALTGIFMSVEAMFITIGLMLTLDTTTVLIPITVAVAHFIFCSVTFVFSKKLRKFPPLIGHLISGLALITYGILAVIL